MALQANWQDPVPEELLNSPLLRVRSHPDEGLVSAQMLRKVRQGGGCGSEKVAMDIIHIVYRMYTVSCDKKCT